MLRSVKSRNSIGSRISFNLRHCSNSSIGIGGGKNAVDIISRHGVFRRSSSLSVREPSSSLDVRNGIVGSVGQRATLSFASSQQQQQQQLLQRLQHCCVGININNIADHVIVHSQACAMSSRSMSSIQQGSSIRHYHQCHHLQQHRHHPWQRHGQQSHCQPYQMHPSNTTAAILTATSHQQRRSKVFVSRHNQTLNLTSQSITSFILAHLPHLNPSSSSGGDNDFRITSSHVILKECPF